MKKQTIFILIGIIAAAAIGFFLYKKYRKPNPGTALLPVGTPISAAPQVFTTAPPATGGGGIVGAVNNLLSPNPTPSNIVANMPAPSGGGGMAVPTNNIAFNPGSSNIAAAPNLPMIPNNVGDNTNGKQIFGGGFINNFGGNLNGSFLSRAL